MKQFFRTQVLPFIFCTIVIVGVGSFFWHLSDTEMNQYDNHVETCQGIAENAQLLQGDYATFMVDCLRTSRVIK